MASFFIDSNVLIYAEASDEPKKRQAALTLLRKLKLENTGELVEGVRIVNPFS